MAMARTPLYSQIVLASFGVIALSCNNRIAFFHSSGLMEHVYGWMFVASWVFMLWLSWEVIASKEKRWKRIAVLLLSVVLTFVIGESIAGLTIRC
jgi:hypothetical protein